jgi:hypothetical protein
MRLDHLPLSRTFRLILNRAVLQLEDNAMKQSLSSFAKALFLFGIATAFVCADASSHRVFGALLQRRTQREAPPRNLGVREHQLSQLEREGIRKREPKEVMAEINEDLTQLRALSGGISVHAAATDQPLHYHSIGEHVTEIKKRSTRLRTDLALPQAEKNEKHDSFKDAEKGELQPALAALNRLLDSFLHNPIFSDAGAIDMQLAAKAGRDLDDIIVLSEKLRKKSDKRSKSSSETQ